MKTRFVNLFGAPGVGKSTTAAGVYAQLSQRGFDVELVPEFAKELVWEDNISALTNQAYVTAKQFYMISRLNGKCRWVITDSPAFLGAAYCTQAYPQSYIDTLYWYHTQTDSQMNYLIQRSDQIHFQPKGRVHNELESKMVMDRIVSLLSDYDISVTICDTHNAIHNIVQDIMMEEDSETQEEITKTQIDDVAVLGGGHD